MKKSEERNIRKLTRTGGGKSFSITLPVEFVRALGWKDHQKVAVRKMNGALVIRDWKRR